MSEKPLSEDRIKYRMAAMRQRRQREASKTPLPARITMALDVRGLYGPEVDIACGAQEPDVDRWEDPADPLLPTRQQVELLAKLTGYPVLFFYTPEKVKIELMFLCGDDGCQVIDKRPPHVEPVDELAARREKRGAVARTGDAC